jgi:3-oxoacyl-[acyl-carrier-protein] synthase II
MGEGSGIIVLEEYNHAKKRGAKIYCELIGYGMSGDAYHITAPSEDGDGGFRAMVEAIKMANISTDEVGYINAHGTSTILGDQIELNAIIRLFNNNKNIFASSTKSSIGHLLGAAGSVEAIFSILAINNSIIPATLNLVDPIDSNNINLISKETLNEKINIALSNSFGFGGTNTALLFKNI